MEDSINTTIATTEETTTTDTLNAIEETVSTTTENTKTEQEENTVVETTSQTAQEETYPVKDLIENCKALTGYKKEVAIGALFNCEKQQITKKEFQGRIKNFLGKKVK